MVAGAGISKKVIQYQSRLQELSMATSVAARIRARIRIRATQMATQHIWIWVIWAICCLHTRPPLMSLLRMYMGTMSE